MASFGFRTHVDIVSETGAPELFEDETIDFHLANVELAFEKSKAVGRGALFVTSRRVLWIGEKNAFDFDVPFIVLHAITRDADSYPTPCLYCQLDHEEQFDEEGADAEGEPEEAELGGESRVEVARGAESDNDNSAVGRFDDSKSATQTVDYPVNNEFFLSPLDEGSLNSMFQAFSHAALMNPDPEEDGYEEGDDELIYNVDEVVLGAQQAQKLAHLESVFQCPEDEFSEGIGTEEPQLEEQFDDKEE